MKYIDEFKDVNMARGIAECITRDAIRPIKLMEVCGTHTMSIARYGIKGMLPENVKLISGPGCPVCVTPNRHIDRFMELGRLPDTILTSFGDMLRVPGSNSSLEAERAKGSDVRIVYSPFDAVMIARDNPSKRVFFFGVGFETTTPSVALAVMEAQRLGVSNFYVLCAHKVIPPALEALASDPEIDIDGFICPGHVSVILGSDIYETIAKNYGLSCVVVGFEPLDILQGIHMLVKQIVEDRAEVEVQYARVVTREGNVDALRCMNIVFEPADAEWRGLGCIPMSGLKFRPEFAAFDASQFLPLESSETEELGLCKCGSILKGQKSPVDCPAFGVVCTPENPIGPCMVSNEGACAAEYRYSSFGKVRA